MNVPEAHLSLELAIADLACEQTRTYLISSYPSFNSKIKFLSMCSLSDLHSTEWFFCSGSQKTDMLGR